MVLEPPPVQRLMSSARSPRTPLALAAALVEDDRAGLELAAAQRAVAGRAVVAPRPMEAAGAVDAKSMRPPLLGKLQNSFPQLPQAIIRGHFFVKNGDVSICALQLGPDRADVGGATAPASLWQP